MNISDTIVPVDEDHDLQRPARLVAVGLLTEGEVKESCCCMVGYNGCCGICHDSCPTCEGVGRLDYGMGAVCSDCRGSGGVPS